MTEIAFYHLSRSRLEDAIPRLLERTLAAGKRAFVLAGSPERVEWLTSLLWTYERAAWLPHGSVRDGNASDQPIWISDQDSNANGAEFLFLVDGARSSAPDSYERVFELFDGSDPSAVAHARERWKAYHESGHVVTYWQQGEHGWESRT